MTKMLNERELHRLVSSIVNEQIVDMTNDDANPHKAAHADPSGRNWDAGLDEADDVEHSGLADDVAERVGMVFYDMLHHKFPYEELDRAQQRLEDWVRRIVRSLNK